MPTEKNLSNLIINKVESKEVYNYMVANNLVNEDEMYFVQGDDEAQIVVDSELSTTSANPVQNQVITAAINNLNTLVGDESVSDQINTAIASKADTSKLTAHTGNNTIHITSAERTNWNAAKTHADSAHAPSNAEANQNAFSNVTVGGTTIVADSQTDTLTLVGSNVTLTPDATNDKITIGITKNNVTNALGYVPPTTDTTYGAAGASLGLVKSGGNVTIASGVITVNDDGHNHVVSNIDGLQDILDAKASASDVSALQGLVGDTSVATQIETATANKVDKVDGKGLSTNDYTTDEKTKLSGIASGAEVNQNAFSKVTVGTTTIEADSKTDTLTIAAGDNITLTPDAANDKLTISAKDTVYTHPTYTAKSSGLYKVTVDSTGHVSGATSVVKDDVVALGIPAQDTTYNEATTSAAGLMSASDKTKLNGIAEGANKTIVDSALSATSTNPVQNKVVNTAISNLNTLVGDKSVATQISTAIANKSDSGHTHDDRYYTETEMDSKLSGKSDTSHTHDDRYYTETEMNTKLSNKVDKVEGSRLITSSEAAKLESLVLGDGGQIEISGKVNADNVEGLDELLATKVDKVTGMGLSTNDYTTDEKNKLAGIEAGANKTVVDTALSSTSTNPVQNKVVNAAIGSLNTLVGDEPVASQISSAVENKVDKVDGKGLSTNDYTTNEKNKLAGIATGAEVNQNAFSNVVVGSTTIAADSKTDSLTIVAGNNITLTPDATNDKLTIAATDTVYTHPTYTSKSAGLYKVTVDGTGHVSAATAVAKSDITALGIPAQDTTYSTATQSANGLMSSSDKTKLDGIETGANKTVVDSALSDTSMNPVQNKVVNTAISSLNTLVGDKSVASQITSAINGLNLSSTYIAATQKGAANGVAELDSTGKVPSTQLPSYVDDVLEYSAKSSFPSTGETGKIYVDTATNLAYRWGGSAYTEISPSLALGTTSSTAFRGDYGNTAYTHATAKGSAFASGLYKITTNDQGHVTAATAVAKSDITGLGIPAQDTTYNAATTSAAGLMSAADKTKLDGIATGATKITVDSALSSTSTNPVQNKVVTASINNLNTLVGDKSVATQISTAIVNKVDKEDGKGLSTNDYTTEEKEKLASVGEWTQLYDSGETTAEVNSFSGIDITGYKNLMVAIKCVNTTNTASTRSGAVYFTGSNSQDYAFNNIFSNLIKSGTTTSGAMAKFKIVDGFIICETAMRAITADGILSDTEGAGLDTLAPVSGGLIRCTSTITTMAVTTAGQSATHYYGAGSRVIVWGCKA